MAIEKGFIQNKNQLFETRRRKLTFGGIIWIVLAVSFFNFLNFLEFYLLLFESLRNDFEPYFLQGTTKFYYDLGLGAISVHFSFAIVYRYWLDAPKKLGQRKIYQRKSAISNARVFNWFFLHWFFELGFILTLFLPLVKGVNLYPEYTYLVSLCMLVFFGQIWISIRPIVKKRLIWFLCSGVIFFTSSYLVPKLNFVNPKKIESKIVEKNLIYQNDIHIVSSDVLEERKFNADYCLDILVSSQMDSTIFFEGEKMSLQRYIEKISKKREEYSFSYSYERLSRLFIDKNTPMKKVLDLKKAMDSLSFDRVALMFHPPEDTRPFYYKSDVGLWMDLYRNVEDVWEADDPEIVSIEIIDEKQVIFQGDSLNHKDFRARLKSDFESTETKSVRVFMKPKTTFQTYFRTIESIRKVIEGLRNKQAQKGYATNYQSLTREQKKAIIEIHRWHIIDRFQE